MWTAELLGKDSLCSLSEATRMVVAWRLANYLPGLMGHPVLQSLTGASWVRHTLFIFSSLLDGFAGLPKDEGDHDQRAGGIRPPPT